MSPTQAASIIGCTPQQVRTLIRTGKLKARKKPTTANQHGYLYEITEAEAVRVRDTEQTRGWPRGTPRS